MPNTSIRGHFVWHELMTSDTKSAERFYARVVGWTPEAWGQDPSYKMWMAGGRPMGGLMGIPRGEGTPPPPQWFCYIGTPDVDATVRQAVELGGKVMKPAQDLPTVGRFAFLFDPQGAAFAAFTPAPSSMPRNAGEPGLADFSWHELATTNWQAAWDFYSKLFGWQKTSAMDMGPQGTYQMFGLDGRVLGGMYSSTALPGPPSWLRRGRRQASGRHDRQRSDGGSRRRLDRDGARSSGRRVRRALEETRSRGGGRPEGERRGAEASDVTGAQDRSQARDDQGKAGQEASSGEAIRYEAEAREAFGAQVADQAAALTVPARIPCDVTLSCPDAPPPGDGLLPPARGRGATRSRGA